jgi:hypothetical protein
MSYLFRICFIPLHLAPSLFDAAEIQHKIQKKWFGTMTFHDFPISNHHRFSFPIRTGPTSPAAWIEPPGQAALVLHDVKEMVWIRTEHFTNNDGTTGNVDD